MDEVVAGGSEGCNYLLAVDVDMNTVDGYAMSSWSSGYGDFVMRPDFATLRRCRGSPAPRWSWPTWTRRRRAGLRLAPADPARQLDRLAEHGLTAFAGTELEFVLYQDSYEQAFDKNYRDLTPANQYNVDYSLLGTARVEPLLRRIRNEMYGAGLLPESAKGECNFGQHEIAFRYADALTCADNHVIYKNGAKEIAAQEGMALTFMAKPNEREGNSCHIHFSLRGADGPSAMLGDGPGHLSVTGQRVLAGCSPPCASSACSSRRTSTRTSGISPGRSRRPRALGRRQPHLRAADGGHGQGMRVENRVPGGDVNPYLAIAALIAGATARAGERTRAGGRVHRQRVRGRGGATGAGHVAGRRPSCGSSARSRRRRSGRTSWRTTRTWPRSSWPPSTPRSPTGNSAEGSNGYELTRVRIDP
jgi:glutamine synthetase